MSFYHDYFVRYKINNKNINQKDFNSFYSLKDFSLSKINNFFKNYDSMQLLRQKYSNRDNDLLNYFSPKINELFMDSVKNKGKLENDFINKEILPSQEHHYYEENNEKSLFLAIEINDLTKVEKVLNSGIKLTSKYPYLSKIKDMELLKLLLTEDMIDVLNKNHYPRLAQIAYYNYPLKEMIEKGFDINAIDITQLNLCLSEKNNIKSESIQSAYLNLLKLGLNPNKKSDKGNSPLFYITNENVAKIAISHGLDINYKKGTLLLSKIVFDKENTNPNMLSKRVKIIDLLLSKGALFGEDIYDTINDNKLIGISDIPKEYLDVLMKHNRINIKEMKLTVMDLQKNPKLFEKMIKNKLININNLFLGSVNISGQIINDLKDVEKKISSVVFQALINNVNDFNEKSRNGNTFIEQCLLEKRVDLIEKLPIKINEVDLKGNSDFIINLEPKNGKITAFHFLDDNFYSWLKTKKLIQSKEKYTLKELEKIKLPLGQKLYEDGLLKDELINPLVTEYVNCRKGALSIYAIKNNNLSLMKDVNGKDLLFYCANEGEASYLLKRKAIKITEKLEDYPHQIHVVIKKRMKVIAENEKKEIIANISKNNLTDKINKKKRL